MQYKLKINFTQKDQDATKYKNIVWLNFGFGVGLSVGVIFTFSFYFQSQPKFAM